MSILASHRPFSGDRLIEVCLAFGLRSEGDDSPLEFSVVEGGCANVSFFVRSQRCSRVVSSRWTHIVTFCVYKEFSSEKQVSNLCSLLRLLENDGIRTNHVLPVSSSGQYVYMVAGIPVIVKDYIPGSILESVNSVNASRIGHVLAQIHCVPPPEWMEETEEGRTFLVEIADLETIASRWSSASDSTFSTWMFSVLEGLDSLRISDSDSCSFPKGLVHFDLFPDSMILTVDEEEEEVFPIDFESACVHYLVLDIATTLVGFAHAESLTLENVRSMFRSYSAYRPIEEFEMKNFAPILDCAAAKAAAWRYENAQKETTVGEVRDWRVMRCVHELNVEWSRQGVWGQLLQELV